MVRFDCTSDCSVLQKDLDVSQHQFKSLLSMIILLCVIHGVNGVQKQPSPKPNQKRKGYVLLLINAGVRSSVTERKKSRRLLH
jgi:hypothetical protein